MKYVKNEKDIEYLREGGKMLAAVLDEVQKLVRVGVTTQELDAYAEKRICELGALPSFKGYRNSLDEPEFPTTLCTSVNNEIVHAPASSRVLKDGDIVGIDIGLKFYRDGRDYFVDMARTVGVGKISREAKKLLSVTKKSLDIGLQQVRSGNYISDIGKAIQVYVESHGFSVVRALVGHGVGYKVHEEPRIPNYYTDKMPKIEIQKGMALAIEPMVNMGSYEIETLDDGWTIATKDGSLSAHFEHTVAVTEKGCEILTV
ncbi:MAG: type I methionyl aminopeptidase [Candidatus Yanofskybacteria bacterium RIFCSPHIGHO2_01_FULL_39_8b]|uniref:Methionine aminopeptidase n=1 Tax=Candidatus Yanofskybacteria bacterium RIFCSPHIGHO2_01_FULL_39_8b TaxID=1802659 RepID=A0A1F8E8Z0_9BACT|nr:MAG: type I methionyl aminopeptidase [Candidatus Yanofskybacteria bacterium RIFCSPHIGHO2_01_FULL_39_8b]